MGNGVQGKVYLIGTGPGDPDLVTLKAWRVVRECDVVLYDSLVPDELIVLLSPETEKIYVGKRGGKPSTSQDDINRLMVQFASEGKKVARLKGGDPIVFGRGSEEAIFLKENGIRCEIIPGITAGVAGPTYAGIPCTDRKKASFVMFLTGHKAKEKEVSTVPWDWVAKAKGGTLVIYMGVGQISEIVSQLIHSGMSPETPSAVIERGTFPSQRSFVSKLKELPKTVAENKVKAPSLFVIGEVVDLQAHLDWFEGKPLLGKRILVTRAAEQAAETYAMLRELGAEVLPYPTIAIEEHIDEDAWEAFERIDSSYRWLVFTSANGVRYFMRQLMYRIGDMRHLALFSIAAVGSGTANVLKRYGITPDFVPSSATVANLAVEFRKYVDDEGATIVRVRGELAHDTFEDELKDSGFDLLPLTVYRTSVAMWPPDLKDKLFEYPPHAITFTSGSTVDGLLANLDDDELLKLTSSAKIFSIGPSTSKKLREYGLKITLESSIHTIPGLVEALVKHMVAG